MTIAALLTAWDAGEPVALPRFTAVGPSHDQGVYILALEMARDAVHSNRPVDSVFHKSSARVCRSLGLDLAQEAMARWVARTIMRLGPDAVAEGNAVIVRRDFPNLPPPQRHTVKQTPDARLRQCHHDREGLPGPVGTDFPRRVRTKPKAAPAGGYIGEALGE